MNKEAMRLALEALEDVQPDDPYPYSLASKAITALREALNAPLAEQPAQRKPLTDEQIDKLPWGPHEGNPMTFAEGLRDFARAIEAAHGIKENT